MVKKKIIFLIPTLIMGGGERVVSELSLGLPDSFEKIIVLFKNEVFYPYKGKLISLNLSFSKGFLFKIYYFLKGLYRLRKIVKKEKPDHIIAFGFSADLVGIFASKNTLVCAHSFWTNVHGGIIEKSLIKMFFNKSKKVICVSEAVAEDLIKNFRIRREKIKVIPNPIDVGKIKKLASFSLQLDYQKIFNSPVIINMGRLSKEKNQYSLIRAFKEIKDKIKTAKLVILGDGEKRIFLEKLIKELGLENSVYLLGRQDNPFKFLDKAKVFVSSSQREGLPCSILEAMACGLPIISADCKSGPREILAPGTDTKHQAKDIEYAEFGILTPIFDKKIYKFTDPLTESEKKLAEAVIKVLTDKKLSDTLAEKSKQRVISFDIEKIIKKWDFLF
ncbi:glycosyltransferase [Candidatus Parcubacteria bacterium]|nr:glycosyltransferase [Candidatus Parcubacteria bacterium]